PDAAAVLALDAYEVAPVAPCCADADEVAVPRRVQRPEDDEWPDADRRRGVARRTVPGCVDVSPDRRVVREFVRALFGDDILRERRLAVRREVQRHDVTGGGIRDAAEDANRVSVDDPQAREA